MASWIRGEDVEIHGEEYPGSSSRWLIDLRSINAPNVVGDGLGWWFRVFLVLSNVGLQLSELTRMDAWTF